MSIQLISTRRNSCIEVNRTDTELLHLFVPSPRVFRSASFLLPFGADELMGIVIPSVKESGPRPNKLARGHTAYSLNQARSQGSHPSLSGSSFVWNAFTCIWRFCSRIVNVSLVLIWLDQIARSPEAGSLHSTICTRAVASSVAETFLTCKSCCREVQVGKKESKGN